MAGEKATVVTLDMTPEWAGLMPAFIGMLQSGTPQEQEAAKVELMDLATKADAMVAHNKALKAQRDEYVIWSHEHSAWWGHNWRGYTRLLECAGTYDRDEAIKICRQRDGFDPTEPPSEVPVLKSDITACVCVPGQQ